MHFGAFAGRRPRIDTIDILSVDRGLFILDYDDQLVIGGIAGFLVLSANAQVTAMLGMWATLKGLIAMMIGGLGSIPGAIVGGLVLGVIEVHSQALFGPQVRDLAAYGVLFVLLVLRPGGIFGTAAVSESAAHRGGDRWTTT